MATKLRFFQTLSFQRDCRKLQRRYGTLNTDLEVAKRGAIELRHIHGLDNRSVVRVPGYGNDAVHIYKLRKFACLALKGKGARSGIRIIYAYDVLTKVVTLLEIYHKSDQADLTRQRIDDYLQGGVEVTDELG